MQFCTSSCTQVWEFSLLKSFFYISWHFLLLVSCASLCPRFCTVWVPCNIFYVQLKKCRLISVNMEMYFFLHLSNIFKSLLLWSHYILNLSYVLFYCYYICFQVNVCCFFQIRIREERLCLPHSKCHTKKTLLPPRGRNKEMHPLGRLMWEVSLADVKLALVLNSMLFNSITPIRSDFSC